MEHDIVFDLLPLYHDGVCSAASRTAVEEHLKGCETCRQALSEMDAPLPAAEEQKNAADGAAVKKISEAWQKEKWRARVKGAAVAAAVCCLLYGGFYVLTNWNCVKVSTDVLEVTDLNWTDGQLSFHLFVNDEKDLREVRYEYDAAGNMYVVTRRPLLIGDRSTVGGLWDWEYDIDVRACSETAAERGAAEIVRVYLGRGESAILLWEKGGQ